MRLHGWRVISLVVIFVFLLLCASGLAEDSKFYGKWRVTVGEAKAGLLLKNDGTGIWKTKKGQLAILDIKIKEKKIIFWLDKNKSGEVENSDIKFQGAMGSDTNKMSGAMIMGNKKKDWKATRFTGNSTEEPTTSQESTKAAKGMTLTTDKTIYHHGERVNFLLHNNTERIVNMANCQFVIQKREGNRGVEFFTSRTDPFAQTIMNPGDKKTWSWDQWDNEHENMATPGMYRIILTIPDIPKGKVGAKFRIQ